MTQEYGELVRISISVDKKTAQRIDSARGRIGRISKSAFVANVLAEVFENFPEQEA